MGTAQGDGGRSSKAETTSPNGRLVWSCLLIALLAWFVREQWSGEGAVSGDQYFPRNCRWKTVRDADSNVSHPMDQSHRSYLWRQRVYTFYSPASSASLVPPAACTVAGHSVDARDQIRGTPIAATSERSERNASYRIIENLWYARGSFYKVIDPDHPEKGSPASLSSNINLYTIAVENITAFVENTKSARFVRGETVMLDFSYFVHPTAIGHWLEYLLPVMSARRLEGLDNVSPSMVLVMHLKRCFVFEWVRAAIGAALGTWTDFDHNSSGGKTLPFPLIFQEETASVWDQMGQRFEGVRDDEWVCFEKVVVAKDVVDDGPRTALVDEGGERDAQRFREQMWRMYAIESRGEAVEIGRKRRRITLLHKSANRRIVNRDSVRRMLAEFGDVDEVELTAGVSMASQIYTMANTDVLVSTHTSGLANAMFLPPGALVVEIRHKNFLEDMEQTFELQIKSIKDVHWVEWKATEIVYLHRDDERKFKAWGDTCDDVAECVEAGTLVDVVVDVGAVRQLIIENLH